MKRGLTRIFTVDVRREFLPVWDTPTFYKFFIDEIHDTAYSLLGHVLFAFSISDFPLFSRGDINAVYIRSIYFDKKSGLLAIGGHDQSGNPPLQLFDTNTGYFRWVITSASFGFRQRVARYEHSLERRYGGHVKSHPIRSVDFVSIDPHCRYVFATANEPSAWQKETQDAAPLNLKKMSSLKKFNIEGDLRAENFDLAPSDMVFDNSGSTIAAVLDNHLIIINSDTLDLIRAKNISKSAISSLCLDGKNLIVCATVEGEVLAVDFELNIVWKRVFDSMVNCVRYINGIGIVAGTTFGDLIILDNEGIIKIHERVSESIRDIGALHDGRHLLVGCKNMDIHVFLNEDIVTKDEKQIDWERRLEKANTSVYTSTSSLTKARIFLSYSSKDARFARKIESRMQEIGLSCWRDEHDLVAGRITRQLKKAILENDVLLVILSRHSIQSDWVRWEVESARQQEKTAKKDIICPITLDSAWRDWDDDPVLKREIEKYHIVSFEEYDISGNFEAAFTKLITGLKENYLIDEIRNV